MLYYIIAAVALALGVACLIAFFVLKRALKWAVRASILGAALALLAAGGGIWLWRASRNDAKPRRPAQRSEDKTKERRGDSKPDKGKQRDGDGPAGRRANRSR